MASAYSRVRQYGEFLQPINVKLVGEILKTKQQQYDTNYLLVQQTMDRVANLDLIRPVDSEYLQDRLNQVNNLITQAGTLDLSSNAVTTSLIKGINSAIDNNVINAYMGTKQRRKELEEIENLRKKDPNKYNVLNYAAYNEKFEQWYDNPEAGVVYSGSTYVPYTDIDKEVQDLMVKAHNFLKVKTTETTPVVGPDGAPYLQTKSKTVIDPERVRMLVQSKLSTLQPQIEINARFGTNPEAIEQNYKSLMTQRVKTEEGNLAYYMAAQKAVGEDTEDGRLIQQSIDNIQRNIDAYKEESLRGYTEQAGANMYRMYLEDSFVSSYSGTLINENKLAPNTALIAMMRLELDREKAAAVNNVTSDEQGPMPSRIPDDTKEHKGEKVEELIQNKINELEITIDKNIVGELEALSEQLIGEGEFEKATGISRNTNLKNLSDEDKDKLIETIRRDGSKFSPEMRKAIVELDATKEAYVDYRKDVLSYAELTINDFFDAYYQSLEGTGRESNTIARDYRIPEPGSSGSEILLKDYIPNREEAKKGSGYKVRRNGQDEELTKEEYARAVVALQYAKYYGSKSTVNPMKVGRQDDYEMMMNYAAQVFSGVSPESYLETKAAAKKAREVFNPSIWDSYSEQEGFLGKIGEFGRRLGAGRLYPRDWTFADDKIILMEQGIQELADLYGGNGSELVSLMHAVGVNTGMVWEAPITKEDTQALLGATDSSLKEIKTTQDYQGEAQGRDFRAGVAKVAKNLAVSTHLNNIVTREMSRYDIPIKVGAKEKVQSSGFDALINEPGLGAFPKEGVITFSMQDRDSRTLKMSWYAPPSGREGRKYYEIRDITAEQIDALGIDPDEKAKLLNAMNVNQYLGINTIGRNRPNVMTSLADNSVRSTIEEVIKQRLAYNDVIEEYREGINVLSGANTSAPLGVRLAEKLDRTDSTMWFEYTLGGDAFAAEPVPRYLTEAEFDRRMDASNHLIEYFMRITDNQLLEILNNLKNNAR